MSNDKKKNSSIDSISSTKASKEIASTENVEGVGQVKATTSIAGVSGVGSVQGVRLTRIMSLEERESYLKMVEEEADKLFEKSIIPQSKRKAIKSAVKMAIDAGLIADDKKKGKK
jgi:hypothetical protein